MSRTRTVQPLPRHTVRVWLEAKKRWAYYFQQPAAARDARLIAARGECRVGSEALGFDYAAAVARVEEVLLPAYDAWRTLGLSDLAAPKAHPGTLDWLFAQYRDTDKFRKLSKGMRALHEAGFALIGGHRMADGRALGAVGLSSIDTGVVDRLYEKLLPMRDAAGNPLPLVGADGAPVHDKEGRPVPRERRTTVNHAMKSCRRAWNVAYRLNRDLVPAANPFARMGLVGSDGKVTEATWPELQAAVAAADARGLKSLAAGLLVTWEWLQREEHVFTAFRLKHYRPKERPNEVLIVHPKTGAEVWVPLFDAAGAALFPELMARMDALKARRIGDESLFFLRDWIDRAARRPLPWATGRGQIDLVRKKTKEIVRAAGLRGELSFTSFRHGGFTELGDAELTDAQIRALSRQKSAEVVKGYVKPTQRQIIEGTKKRRAIRPRAAAHAGAEQLSFDALLKGGAR